VASGQRGPAAAPNEARRAAAAAQGWMQLRHGHDGGEEPLMISSNPVHGVIEPPGT